MVVFYVKGVLILLIVSFNAFYSVNLYSTPKKKKKIFRTTSYYIKLILAVVLNILDKYTI